MIPSSLVSADFLFTEDWTELIPVSYDNIGADENVFIEEDDFELELQNGILDDGYELDIDDEPESESES